jgi:hypothetical protein
MKAPRTAVTVPITEAERTFLLLGLQDVVRTVKAVLHGRAPPGTQLAPQWSRQMLVQHTWKMINTLRHGGRLLLVGAAQQRLLIEAIEGNPYFILDNDDPRLNARAIRLPDELRFKIQRIVKRPVRRFQIGRTQTVVVS